MKSKFNYSLENFRGIAIIFVMLSHILSIQSMGKASNYLFFFFVDATAWFVFISGYLFYLLEVNKFNYLDYLNKKLKYVVLPYLILSIPVIFIGLCFSRNVLYDLNPFQYTIWSLITGGMIVAPMWFIPMIVIFFLLTPVFNAMSKSKIIYILTFIGLLFSIFSSRPVHNTNPFLSFLHFSGFYLFGISAAKSIDFLDALTPTAKRRIIVISFIMFFLAGACYQGIENGPGGFYDSLGLINYIIVGKLALLIAIFFIFEKFFNKKKIFIGYLAKISFGLFFIHGFMSQIFGKFLQNSTYSSPFIKLLTEIGVVVFVSVAVVFLLKLIMGKWSRYVIGC